MPTNSEILLSNQTHPGDSTLETRTGEPVKGDGYYGRSDGFHTVQYSLNGFLGSIAVQATLVIEPEESDWFTVTETVHESGSTESAEASGGFIYNFTGNYVWVRAHVYDWFDGTVRSILLNH